MSRLKGRKAIRCKNRNCAMNSGGGICCVYVAQPALAIP